jgi:hypothetical protein
MIESAQHYIFGSSVGVAGRDLTPVGRTDKVGIKSVFSSKLYLEQGRPARVARGFAAGFSSRNRERCLCRS